MCGSHDAGAIPATRLEVEDLLTRWSETRPCAPARLPWKAGLVADKVDIGQAASPA